MTKTLKISTFICAASLILLTGTSTFAQTEEHGIDLPVAIQSQDTNLPEETTHPALDLTPDKSELIRLGEEITSIFIGNPVHINVIADSTDTLVVVPRQPGATHFTVLGKKGQVLMQRHVIVAAPKEGYVRVKRTCNENSGDGCERTSVYYCPDMCHQIAIENQQSASPGKKDNSNSEGNGNGNGNNSEPTDE